MFKPLFTKHNIPFRSSFPQQSFEIVSRYSKPFCEIRNSGACNTLGWLVGWLAGQSDSCYRIPTVRFVPQNTNNKIRATDYQQ